MSSVAVHPDDREVLVFEFQNDFLGRLHDHLGLVAFQRLDVIEMIHGDLVVALHHLDRHVVIIAPPH